MEFLSTFVQLLDATIRVSVPLLLACLAGLYSERSGVFDIGLEGKMLAGAFAGGGRCRGVRQSPGSVSLRRS